MNKIKLAKTPKEKHKYVFPNIMAKMMKNVPMNVQLESSMMATTLILLGLILMGIYSLVFTQQTIGLKLLIGLNLVGGFIFMMSTLVTTYQQYVSYMDVMDLQKSMIEQGGLSDLGVMGNMPNLAIDDLKMETKKYNRMNQLLFFGGIILVILAICCKTFLLDNAATWITPMIKDIIFGVLLLLGIIMIIMPFIKLKIEKNRVTKLNKTPIHKQMIRPTQRQVQQQSIQRPIQRPVQPYQQVQIPIQRPQPVSRPVQAIQRPLVAKQLTKPQLVFRQPQQLIQKPVQSPIQPIQRPQQVARPLIRRPIQQVQVQQSAQTKPNIFSRFRRPISNQPRIMQVQPKKADIKSQKVLDSVKRTLDEKLYEINRLKSQQR